MKQLSLETIQQTLANSPFVRRVVYLPATGSTNDIARELAHADAPEATLVITDEQTAGRGRLGRAWYAPPGTCLLLSLLVRPQLPPLQALRLTMIAGLAVVEAVETLHCNVSTTPLHCNVSTTPLHCNVSTTPLHCNVSTTPLQCNVSLKWPNDIWLNGKKAGGILTEAGITGDQLEYAIVGIGLNVNVDFGQSELEGIATSLMLETGQTVDRLVVLHGIMERFAAWYADITSPRLQEAWAKRLVTLGQWVNAQHGAQLIAGLAEGVDDTGALLVRTPDGTLHTLMAGDVTLHKQVV
jgi:BirA family biotin operon repressor/biotin-[acetyl-CoA-carboxylase] ligase